jgi:Protein ChrB, N-terminal
VRTWRKLQKLGAVSIKNSVYILPFNEKTNEDFQWLKQEIESAGGEAAVFQADSVEETTDHEIVAVFQTGSDQGAIYTITILGDVSDVPSMPWPAFRSRRVLQPIK